MQGTAGNKLAGDLRSLASSAQHDCQCGELLSDRSQIKRTVCRDRPLRFQIRETVTLAVDNLVMVDNEERSARMLGMSISAKTASTRSTIAEFRSIAAAIAPFFSDRMIHDYERHRGVTMAEPVGARCTAESLSGQMSVQVKSRSGDVSRTCRLFSQQRPFAEASSTSALCQRTKSLRSSPLRGGKSRETGSQLRGKRWRV
jgi:hypothetical protein